MSLSSVVLFQHGLTMVPSDVFVIKKMTYVHLHFYFQQYSLLHNKCRTLLSFNCFNFVSEKSYCNYHFQYGPTLPMSLSLIDDISYTHTPVLTRRCFVDRFVCFFFLISIKVRPLFRLCCLEILKGPVQIKKKINKQTAVKLYFKNIFKCHFWCFLH